MNKKNILKYILIFLTLAFSFLTWNAIDRAINVREVSVWLAPIFFFSLNFIFLSLTIILVEEERVMWGISFIIIFLSAIFIFNVWHLLVLLLSFVFLLIAAGKIREDLRLNIKIDVYKCIQSGSTFLLLALSLSISSHYFFETKNNNLENIIPKFNITGVLNSITPEIISVVNPEFQDIDQKNLSVDQWILENEKEKIIEVEKINPSFGATSRDFVLQEGRAQLENFAGFEIDGEEKLVDVATKILSNRINNFIVPDYADTKIPILSFVLSLALFLTIFSLGSFLRPFWTWAAQFLFWIFKKTKIIRISKKMEEVETVE